MYTPYLFGNTPFSICDTTKGLFARREFRSSHQEDPGRGFSQRHTFSVLGLHDQQLNLAQVFGIFFALVMYLQQIQREFIQFLSEVSRQQALPEQRDKGSVERRRNLCSPLETRSAFEMLTHQLAQLLGFSLLVETVLSSTKREKEKPSNVTYNIFKLCRYVHTWCPSTVRTRVRFSLDTNVDAPFFPVFTPEFGRKGHARVRCLNLVLRH